MAQKHRIRCPAKLNLFLHITGKRPNGYHDVDGIVMFAEDLYDELIIEESEQNQIIVNGKWQHLLVGKNILDKALELFNRNNIRFKITLTKNIPIGAGLGGGSSDAGALIRFLVNKFKYDLTEEEIIKRCTSIGADVPLCYYSHALYMSGIGEVTSPATVPTIWAVIVYPNVHVVSKDVYTKGFKQHRPSNMERRSFKDSDVLFKYLHTTGNDLFENALCFAPMLQHVVNAIAATSNCKLARMSGSGSACFGLFDNPKDAKLALKSLQKQFPDYSTYCTKLK